LLHLKEAHVKTETLEVHICGECGEKYFDANECAICEQFDVVSSRLGDIHPNMSSSLEAKRGDIKTMLKIIGTVRSISDSLWGKDGQFRDFDMSCIDKKVEPPSPRPPEKHDPFRRAIRI
jgi:hypothetical protein